MNVTLFNLCYDTDLNVQVLSISDCESTLSMYLLYHLVPDARTEPDLASVITLIEVCIAFQLLSILLQGQ